MFFCSFGSWSESKDWEMRGIPKPNSTTSLSQSPSSKSRSSRSTQNDNTNEEKEVEEVEEEEDEEEDKRNIWMGCEREKWIYVVEEEGEEKGGLIQKTRRLEDGEGQFVTMRVRSSVPPVTHTDLSHEYLRDKRGVRKWISQKIQLDSQINLEKKDNS